MTLLLINQPSIHRSNIDADVPSLAFPEAPDRKQYADTLCAVLNRHARKHRSSDKCSGTCIDEAESHIHYG